jgi:hypothetical protein
LIGSKDLLRIGLISTLGLSVSLLFANLARLGEDLSATYIGILGTIPLALIGIWATSKAFTAEGN